MATVESSPRPSLRGRGAGLGAAPVSLLLVAVAAGLVVGSFRSGVFAQLTVQGLALGAVYGSLALALVLVYRATHVVNFAQGELAMATTYVAYQLTRWGLSYWEAFFAALRPAESALVGVRVDWMLAIGWGLAAMLGAVAGLMAEPSQYFLQPTLMQPILVYAFAAAVLGGLESPVGAVIGGLAIGVSLNLVIQYVPQITSELQTPVAFAVLVAVLLLKPSGLFGRREVRRV
jgi:branched-subunit amino acid ABC-type transport system permease component